MVNSLGLEAKYLNGGNIIDNATINTSQNIDNSDISIFANAQSVEQLEATLDAVQEQQGCITNAWDKFKGTIGIGTSSEKCDAAIEKYKNGEISFDEAMSQIEKFSKKQNNSLELFSNIITSVAAIGAVAAVVATGGTALPIVAAIGIGAGAGAVTKVGFKLTDRATNEVEGDALEGKQIAKDALTGALTGGLASATMGTASGATSVSNAIIGCAKTGVKTGAISGAANYSIDAAFEEDVEFNVKDFAKSTVTGAVVGGTVGAVMGGINKSLWNSGALKSGCNLKTMVSTPSKNAQALVTKSANIQGSQNLVKDVVANSACTAEYKILNRGIRDIGDIVAA